MMVQLNIGRNVKHIIAILLISSFISVATADDHQKPLIPNTIVTPNLTIIGPEALGPEALEPEAIKLPPEECAKLAQQIKSLNVVETQSDVKMFGLRKAMNELHERGIDPMLVYSGINPEVLNQNLNLFWQLSVQHDEFQRQRNKAYDAIEVAYEKMLAGCNYKPEGKS